MQPATHRDSPPAGAGTGSVGGAGGVVFDRQGRVLVLRHAAGPWVFPKGHLEGSETELEAALREVREEGGVVAACRSPHRTWVTTYRNDAGVWRHITWFACETDAVAAEPTEELFPEAEFLPPEVALERLSFDADRQLLGRILSEAGPFPAEPSA